jgi:hypothetical protein
MEFEFQCKLCNDMLNSPRMLPCGNICCWKCINSQFNETNKFKCKCCENIHEKKNESEYPILANNQLNKTSIEIIEQTFKDELDKLKLKTNNLNDKQQNFKINLSNHCEHARSQIMIKTESIIIDLNKHCDELCKTIDDYENKKNKEWDNKNEYRTNLTKLINDNLLIQDNMMELYTNQTKKTAQLEEAIESMKNNSIKVENQINEMSKKFFNMIYLQNDQEIDIDSIGDIYKAEKYEKFNLTKRNPSSTIFDASFGIDCKHLFVLGYSDNHYTYYSGVLEMYDHFPISKLKDEVHFKNKIDCYNLFNDHIILTSSRTIVIYKYDSVLNKWYHHTERFLPDYIKCITVCADIDNIFTMNMNYEVDCFNWNLDKIKTYGQKTDENQPFFFKNVQQIEIRNKKFYIRKWSMSEDTCISFSYLIDIIDAKNGTLIKKIDNSSIRCYMYKFIIDDDKDHLIVFCDDSIKRYELESGVFISKIDIKGSIPKGYKFLDYKDEIFLLLSKNKKKLYSIKI